MSIIFTTSKLVANPNRKLPTDPAYITEVKEYDDTNPADAQAIADYQAQVAAEELAHALEQLPKDIKAEGLARINAIYPAIKTIDEFKFYADFWTSIAVSARVPQPDFDKCISIYQAAKAALAVVGGYTTLAEVLAYDVTIDPGWPA